MSGFAEWFCRITSHAKPWPWQRMLAEEGLGDYRNRLLRIPTGLGKTEGVLAAWAWHRLILNDETCPRRLVWCLPMRVLVEQTVEVAHRLLERAATAQPTPQAVGRVYPLMGGTDAGNWHLHPERPAVLVGTQDMLLSRALNRGYAAGLTDALRDSRVPQGAAPLKSGHAGGESDGDRDPMGLLCTHDSKTDASRTAIAPAVETVARLEGRFPKCLPLRHF